MNIYRLFILLLTFSLYSCVEKYDINIVNKVDGVVIEATISNISYNKTLKYPSDGRLFQVKLKSLSDVNNVSDKVISNAIVTLIDDRGNRINYTESPPGTYSIYNHDFAAEFGVKYKLNVQVPTGEEFESSWETLPEKETKMGEISVEETSMPRYVWGANNEKRVEYFDGINLNVKLNNNSKEYKNYRWTYDLLWVFISPRPKNSSPVKTCWMTDKHYLKQQTIEKSKTNSSKKLFFIETIGNYRMYTYFSVLIHQQILSEGFYNFNKDLNKQSNRSGIFATPPFNLQTNYKCINGDKSVYGYFGVITEDATRWVFNKDDLSYPIINDIAETCGPVQSPPTGPTSCDSCMEQLGGPSTSPPLWW
ncbi:MAG: DUF4249 domain-containing protein [Chlamydiia bacterium]|nr:DUF4249 domain-containing protein [Chlamydiia bacterium]